MKTPFAILFTLGLFAVCYYGSALVHFDLVLVMVLATSIWASVDSSKLQLKRYKSGISYGPVALLILCLLLWIIAFPWYLAARHKIKSGAATLKETTSNADT